MTVLLIIFMVFAIMTCIFSALVITREIVRDSLERRQASTPAPAPAPAPAQAEAAPTVQQTEAQQTEELPFYPVAEEETPSAQTTEAVRFSTKTAPTLEEKYLALSPRQRGYYDEIVKYAAAVENAKRIKNTRYEEYKVGITRLVRLLIKRETVVCEFILPNADFKNYVNENKVNVQHAATGMKITDDTALQAAKDSVDIVVAAMAQEKEYKRQLALQRRRENRRNKKQQG